MRIVKLFGLKPMLHSRKACKNCGGHLFFYSWYFMAYTCRKCDTLRNLSNAP